MLVGYIASEISHLPVFCFVPPKRLSTAGPHATLGRSHLLRLGDDVFYARSRILWQMLFIVVYLRVQLRLLIFFPHRLSLL